MMAQSTLAQPSAESMSVRHSYIISTCHCGQEGRSPWSQFTGKHFSGCRLDRFRDRILVTTVNKLSCMLNL
jgi:hypothetical protein